MKKKLEKKSKNKIKIAMLSILIYKGIHDLRIAFSLPILSFI